MAWAPSQVELHLIHVPPHEIILLASIFVPDGDVHEAALLIVQVEVELLPPLRVQGFGDCLTTAMKGNLALAYRLTCSQADWKHLQRRDYLALVLLVPHPELGVGVAEAVGVHGLEAAPFDQADADDASPQLSFPVHV